MAAAVTSLIWLFFRTAQDGHGEPYYTGLLEYLAQAMGVGQLTLALFRNYVLAAPGSTPISSHPRGDLTGWTEVLNALEVANPGQHGLSTPQV